MPPVNVAARFLALAKHRFALYVACGNQKRYGMTDFGAWFWGSRAVSWSFMRKL
jgi:hypothetical protein